MWQRAANDSALQLSHDAPACTGFGAVPGNDDRAVQEGAWHEVMAGALGRNEQSAGDDVQMVAG